MADKAVYIGGEMKDISKDDLQWLNTKRGEIIKDKLDEETNINGNKSTMLEHMEKLDDGDFKKIMGELFNDAEREAEALKYIIAPDKGVSEDSPDARAIYQRYQKQMDKLIKSKESSPEEDRTYEGFKKKVKRAINK
jgi:hypothetical protein